jgi:hypothetical protein
MFQAIASRTLGLVAALAVVLAAPPAVYAGSSGSQVPRTGKPSLIVKFDIGGPAGSAASGQGQPQLIMSGGLLYGGGLGLTGGGPAAAGAPMAAPAAPVRVIR